MSNRSKVKALWDIIEMRDRRIAELEHDMGEHLAYCDAQANTIDNQRELRDLKGRMTREYMELQHRFDAQEGKLNIALAKNEELSAHAIKLAAKVRRLQCKARKA